MFVVFKTSVYRSCCRNAGAYIVAQNGDVDTIYGPYLFRVAYLTVIPLRSFCNMFYRKACEVCLCTLLNRLCLTALTMLTTQQ